MRTSVIHERNQEANRYVRACLPVEAPAEYDGTRVAKLWAAHEEKGTRVVSITPFKTRPFTGQRPDSVLGCPLVRGKSECVRVIPEDYVTELDALDRQMLDLSKRRRELVEEAYRHGRPLRKADL
jgi:hypothetical protein